jgi:hypothetical protein
MLSAKAVKRRNGEHPNCEIMLPTGVGYDRDRKRVHYLEDIRKIKALLVLFHVRSLRNYHGALCGCVSQYKRGRGA